MGCPCRCRLVAEVDGADVAGLQFIGRQGQAREGAEDSVSKVVHEVVVAAHQVLEIDVDDDAALLPPQHRHLLEAQRLAGGSRSPHQQGTLRRQVARMVRQLLEVRPRVDVGQVPPARVEWTVMGERERGARLAQQFVHRPCRVLEPRVVARVVGAGHLSSWGGNRTGHGAGYHRQQLNRASATGGRPWTDGAGSQCAPLSRTRQQQPRGRPVKEDQSPSQPGHAHEKPGQRPGKLVPRRVLRVHGWLLVACVLRRPPSLPLQCVVEKGKCPG
jgi:hypothetical protein